MIESNSRMERTNLFLNISTAGRAYIEAEAAILNLAAGETLFRQGESAEHIYFICSGSTGVYVRSPSDEPSLIGVLHAGETIGEMALLSGQPRSATVRAIRSCELLSLTSAQFEELLVQDPHLMRNLSLLLVERLQRTSLQKSPTIDAKTVSLVAGTKDIDISEFAAAVSEDAANRQLNLIVVDEQNYPDFSSSMSEIESSHDIVLFNGQGSGADWVEKCMHHSDRIVVIADIDAREPVPLPAESLRLRSSHNLLDVFLVHKSPERKKGAAGAWARHFPTNRIFHLRKNNPGDWRRFCRLVSRRGIGLVLSGGGARAYAHLGVLQALTENEIPIDFIGGTSMGAIIAAGWANGWSIEELTDRIKAAFVSKTPLNDYQVPFKSLFKGSRVDNLLHENFEDLDIRDLWLPFYCVSTNLTTGRLHVAEKGLIREALRASVALPGVLPPFVHPEGVLVDGAAITNMPIDVMANRCHGPIIAVDVARNRTIHPDDVNAYNALSFRQQISKPLIARLLMRAATITGERLDKSQINQADLVITPDMLGIEIYDWKNFDQAIELGYQAAQKALVNLSIA
ncbi:MAG: patatin-like phospholipase family protein [Methyloligellaceae bacterium]